MIFETARLIARRFRPDDLADFVAMRSDPEVARFQGWENYDEAAGRVFIAELAERAPGQPGWFQFALVEKETQAFVGDCGLDVHAEDPGLARIGYTIVRAQWNRGLASEAVSGLASYAFSHFPITMVTASLDPLNGASCRVLEKAGFVRSGVYGETAWFKGEWPDDLVYARRRGD